MTTSTDSPIFSSECVDLIYLDPPFFSNRYYEVIWGDEAEVRSFEDRWRGGINYYIEWMRDRVIQMHRVLKPTGSLYLHSDWHATHYRLERIVAASSNPNDIVLDPFAGCGTAVVAAQTLGRQWIGIDISPTAVNLMLRRLAGSAIPANAYGMPTTEADLRALKQVRVPKLDHPAHPRHSLTAQGGGHGNRRASLSWRTCRFRSSSRTRRGATS